MRQPGCAVMASMSGWLRQTQIYLDGVSGRRPRMPFDAGRLEAAGAASMHARRGPTWPPARATRRTMRANRAAFDRWRILPRMLRDASRRDTSVELFGQRLSSPFLLAPIGVLELAHREADTAVARAARATDTPVVLSNQASRPMEEVRAAAGRHAALVSALLEHGRRAGGELRRGAPRLRLRRDRGDARHDACWAGGRGISRRPTCPSCAARASPSTPATRFSAA